MSTFSLRRLLLVYTAIANALSFQSNRRTRFATGYKKTSLLATKADCSSIFTIELVSTKKRALDVDIFRKVSITPAEYILRETTKDSDGKTDISEKDAIDLLMPGYDDDGNYVAFDQGVYFVGIHNDTSYDRQNGVMGVCRAQIKNRDCSFTLKAENLGSYVKDPLPPHVYLSNLNVDIMQRRQGVGTALTSAVTTYAKSQTGIHLVLLDVFNDNVDAIQFYEAHGYKYLSQNELSGTMFLAF